VSRPSVTVYRDGPLILRGDVQILDQDGNEIDPGRATVALCRCGKSRDRPFCDGSHQIVRFHAPGERELRRSSAPDRPA
jgi:CDGSH-type Zn-finger protein